MPCGPPTQLRVGRRVDQCPDLAGWNRIPPDFGFCLFACFQRAFPFTKQSWTLPKPRKNSPQAFNWTSNLPTSFSAYQSSPIFCTSWLETWLQSAAARLPVSGKVKVPQAQPSLSMHPTKEESCKAPCHRLLPFSFTRLTRGRSHA